MDKKIIDVTTSCGNFLTKSSVTDSFLNDIRKYPTLTPEEEVELIIKYQTNGDKAARDKVIVCNQRFVYAVAKRYGKSHDTMDLVSECNLGLMDAIELFQPERGFRFLSFGVWYMRCYISQYLNNSSTVKKTNNLRNTTIVNRIKNKFFAENGRFPEIEEIKNIIADKYQIDITNNAMIHEINTISIDSSSTDDEDFTFEESPEFTGRTASINGYVETSQNDYNTELINTALSYLNPRERDIIKYLFGLGEYEGKQHSLQEASEKFDLCSERIRQLRNSAFKHLKPIMKEIINKEAV